MDLLHTLALRVRSMFGARSLERDLSDELEFHVAMQVETNIAAGMTAAEARRHALRQFGGVDRISEECRDARTGSRVHLLVRSVRLAARRLRREPSFTLPALATIAIGFGTLTAIFALADAVLLRPLPYPDADRIVVVRHTLPGWGIATSGQSDGTFVHYHAGATTFESMGAWFDRELSITEAENPERVLAALVTPGVLRTLGVQPLLGRTFNDEDRGARSVMLSHAFWQSRYAGDATIIGRSVRINGVDREIIGVLPPRTDFPHPHTQMLFGMGTVSSASSAGLRDMYMESIGRLRPGVTVEEAEAELGRLAAALPERYGDATASQLAESRLAPRLERLMDSITGEVRSAIVLLVCTAGLVLLIALANVANLVLVRAERQRREVAVERALGAGSGAVVLRFVAEYALLTLSGAALGVTLAWVAIDTRLGFDAWHIPRLEDAALTWRALAVAGAAALVTTALLVITGLARTARVDVQATLKGALHRVTPSRETRAAQHALSAVQVALACALLIASVVMVQSVLRLYRVPLGFTPQHVVAFDVALPVRQYQGYTSQAMFHDRLAEALRAMPGVDAVAAVSDLPLTLVPNWSDAPAFAADAPQPDVPPMITLRQATPEYFQAMGIPLLHGRTFDAGDVSDTGAGVILSAAAARTIFNDVDVIGRRIELPAAETGTLSVVGVVGDVRGATLAAPAAALVYLPSVGGSRLTDGRAPIPLWPGEMTFVVRSTLPHGTLLPAVRDALRRLDPTLPLAYPRTLEDLVVAASARARITAWLLLAAAAGALLLGVVGIYGVIAYTVSRRTPELALRMALGATPGGVMTLVLRQGAAIGILGIAGGIFAAFALTQLLAGLLFEVSPRDPATFLLVPVAMLLVVLAASCAPARRAARTNAASALSAD